MSKHEMAQWEADKEHIMRRMDRFDERFDKIEKDNKEERNKMYAYLDKIDENNRATRDRIDEVKLEVLKIYSGMKAFKGEFKYKTGAWAFLGFTIALAAALIAYLIKNQLV